MDKNKQNGQGEHTPNEKKLSDCGAGHEPCGAGGNAVVAESTANDARNSSLQRGVRPFAGVGIEVIPLREALVSALIESDRSQGSVFDNWACSMSAVEWEEGIEDQQIWDLYSRFVDSLLNSEQLRVCGNFLARRIAGCPENADLQVRQTSKD